MQLSMLAINLSGIVLFPGLPASSFRSLVSAFSFDRFKFLHICKRLKTGGGKAWNKPIPLAGTTIHWIWVRIYYNQYHVYSKEFSCVDNFHCDVSLVPRPLEATTNVSYRSGRERERHNNDRCNYELNWSTYMDSQMTELYRLSVMLLLISAP